MPRTATVVKQIFLILVLCLFLWLIFIGISSETGGGKKYKAKHDYANIYKNKKDKLETPQDAKQKKAFMFRDSKESVRDDLQPRLVYRGTHEEIDPSDIALVRNEDDKKLMDDGYKNFAYNSLVSSRLGVHRDINDTRHKDCLGKTFPENLPTASVIICFYNEEYFTLLRSVFSVIKRSPENLVKEIILINDNSEDQDIINKVSDEISNNPELKKVKLFTPEERLGLIR